MGKKDKEIQANREELRRADLIESTLQELKHSDTKNIARQVTLFALEHEQLEEMVQEKLEELDTLKKRKEVVKQIHDELKIILENR